MIRHAWRWCDDDPASQYYIDILMELEDGSLCGLTYGDQLVFDGQEYLNGRENYDLRKFLMNIGNRSIWMRIL